MDYIAAGLPASAWATTLLAMILFTVYRIGGALISRGVSSKILSAAEIGVFGWGIGMTLLSLGIFVMGVLGFVSAWSVGGFCILLAAVGFLARPGFSRVEKTPHFSGNDAGFLLVACAVVLLAWVQALAPSISMDALAYHLYLPERFIGLGRMEFLPLTRESLWPFNTEMLFMAGLLFQGTQLAQLFHWCFYPMTAAAVYLCALRYYGAPAARWSTLFFLFTPAVFAQSGHAYVDLSLTFFTWMTVYAFLLAGEKNQTSWYAVSGFFCGAAIGTKFLGLGCLLILIPFVWLQSRRNFKQTLVFIAATALVGGGWYVRSWWAAGNPFFPLFHTWFGGHGYAIQMDEGVGHAGKGPLAFLLFPWRVTMFPRGFGGEMIGAIFLTLLPALLTEIRRARPVSRYLAAFGFFYVLFIFSQSQHVRFLITAAPFLAVGSGIAFVRARSSGLLLKFTSTAVIGAMLFLHLGIFAYRLKDKWPVAAGAVNPVVWLRSHERSFQGFEYLRGKMRPSDRLFNAAEVRYFYGPGADRVVHLAQEKNRLRDEKIALADYLRGESFDYIWVTDLTEKEVRDYIDQKGYQLVFSYRFTEKPDTFSNFIYKKP